MAKKQSVQHAAPTFSEVVFKGSPKAVRGLLAGLAIGQDVPATYWFHDDVRIADPDQPRRARRAAEKLHLLPVTEVRAVVSGDLAARLRKAGKEIAATGVCEVAAVRKVRRARAPLRYHTYARRYDAEVQTLLGDLPRGLKLENHERHEEVDSGARGVETYAATHDFESEGCAVLSGRFDLVVEWRDRLDVHPLITCEEIELVTT